MKVCTKGQTPRDVRSMWCFGMDHAERLAAFPCKRPDGHRGDCLVNPPAPPDPLRPLRTDDLLLRRMLR